MREVEKLMPGSSEFRNPPVLSSSSLVLRHILRPTFQKQESVQGKSGKAEKFGPTASKPLLFSSSQNLSWTPDACSQEIWVLVLTLL